MKNLTPFAINQQMNENLLINNSKLTSDSELIWLR